MFIYLIFVLRILVLKVLVLLEVFISRIVVSKVFMFALKMIDLDTKMSTKKIIIAFILKIDNSNIYTTIILIN